MRARVSVCARHRSEPKSVVCFEDGFEYAFPAQQTVTLNANVTNLVVTGVAGVAATNANANASAAVAEPALLREYASRHLCCAVRER